MSYFPRLDFQVKDPHKYHITISASYVSLEVSNAVLPLFVSLKPDKQVVITIALTTKDKLDTLFNVLSKWFTGLKVIELRVKEHD